MMGEVSPAGMTSSESENSPPCFRLRVTSPARYSAVTSVVCDTALPAVVENVPKLPASTDGTWSVTATASDAADTISLFLALTLYE